MNERKKYIIEIVIFRLCVIIALLFTGSIIFKGTIFYYVFSLLMCWILIVSYENRMIDIGYKLSEVDQEEKYL